MAPRRSSDRPTQPWRPAKLAVSGPYRRDQEVWTTHGRAGERVRKVKTSFDVRFRVDGHEFRYSLDQKGWADDFKQRLKAGHAAGWLFDPESRRFLDPDVAELEDRPLTFYEHVREYVHRKWPGWEPASRRNAQRDLARACLALLRDAAPPLTSRDRADADEYLRRAVLAPAPPGATDGDRAWDDWFLRWSRPLAGITDQHLHDLIEAVRVTALDGSARPLAPASVARFRAVLKGAFTNAIRRRLIDWDPWVGVEAEPQRDDERVNPDLVMGPGEIRKLAEACGAVEPRYRAFVLTQGLCGPRPGEAIEIRRRDFMFPAGKPAALIVRGSHSTVPDRFFLDGESRRRPFKGRGQKAFRTIPLPSELAACLCEHLDRFVDPAPDALAFTTATGRRINLSNFHRDVWSPAREDVFSADSPLRQVRRHDLRHSAITMWLKPVCP